MVQLPEAAAGRDQHWPNPTSAIRHPRCDWELVFPLFSPCPRQRQPTWTPSQLTVPLFGKGRGDNGHSGALPHVTGREEPALVTGSRQFWGDEGGFVSKQKLLFVQPVARGCSLCVMERALCCCRAVCIPGQSCPQLHMGCGEKTILPGGKNIKLHLAFAEEGPLCSKLANHPVQISLNFS